MSYATLEMNGKKFVLVPQDEFVELRTRTPLPEYPAANPETGNLPAVEAMRVGMARKLILRREAVGLTQKALATAAGVRIETVNRIEKGKVTPDTATIVKIDKALRRLEKSKQ